MKPITKARLKVVYRRGPLISAMPSLSNLIRMAGRKVGEVSVPSTRFVISGTKRSTCTLAGRTGTVPSLGTPSTTTDASSSNGILTKTVLQREGSIAATRRGRRGPICHVLCKHLALASFHHATAMSSRIGSAKQIISIDSSNPTFVSTILHKTS